MDTGLARKKPAIDNVRYGGVVSNNPGLRMPENSDKRISQPELPPEESENNE